MGICKSNVIVVNRELFHFPFRVPFCLNLETQMGMSHAGVLIVGMPLTIQLYTFLKLCKILIYSFAKLQISINIKGGKL